MQVVQKLPPSAEEFTVPDISRRQFLYGAAGLLTAMAVGGIGQESASAQPNLAMAPQATLPFKYGSIIRRVDTEKPYIAFTFDDGPWPKYTQAIMNHFADFGLEGKATFFQIGNNVRAHQEIAEEVRDRGYTIGNHTMTHSVYKPVPIAREIRPTQELFQDRLGITPRYFRSPGLTMGRAIQRELKKQKMNNIFTDYDNEDWTSPRNSPNYLATKFASGVHSGQIVLLHDGGSHKNTVDAIPYMLEDALNKGLSVVRLTKLLRSGRHVA